MKEKKKREINWIALFHLFWLGPLAIGVGTLFLKLIGFLDISWLLASSPIIFSYSFFALIIIYVAFFQERIEKFFKK